LDVTQKWEVTILLFDNVHQLVEVKLLKIFKQYLSCFIILWDLLGF